MNIRAILVDSETASAVRVIRGRCGVGNKVLCLDWQKIVLGLVRSRTALHLCSFALATLAPGWVVC